MFFAQGPVSGIPAGHPMRTLAAHAKARRSVQPDPAASRLAGVQVVAAALNALGNHSALSRLNRTRRIIAAIFLLHGGIAVWIGSSPNMTLAPSTVIILYGADASLPAVEAGSTAT